MPEVRLPDGTDVIASAIADRQPDNRKLDFGLYLDPAWEPEWPAALIEWPDFGLPSFPDDAHRKIVGAFRRARAGERVEVGCLGGLGRTGTVLACFAVLCGLDPAPAVEWVRTGYDRRAIETAGQEQWVAWFAARMAEGESEG
ncbi:protein-tyrosine phosphatase family protein [soil metagenome]